MAHVLVVTSGKGGVGKTTSTAALGAALARGGERVAVIDFDVGLRNLDLADGGRAAGGLRPDPRGSGHRQAFQALIRDKRIDTLFLLAASQTRDKDSLTEEGVERVIGDLRPSSTGSSATARRASSAEPRSPCATPTRRCRRQPGSVVGTRFRPDHRPAGFDHHQGQARRADGEVPAFDAYDPIRAARGEMLGVEDVLDVLCIPLLGIIPESKKC